MDQLQTHIKRERDRENREYTRHSSPRRFTAQPTKRKKRKAQTNSRKKKKKEKRREENFREGGPGLPLVGGDGLQDRVVLRHIHAKLFV
jgi:hypothetical protein